MSGTRGMRIQRKLTSWADYTSTTTTARVPSRSIGGDEDRVPAARAAEAFPDMPLVSSGWIQISVYLKAEGDYIGIGQGPALDIFNDQITVLG